MLYEVMKHIRNFFVYDKKNGSFSIQDGILSLDIKDGTYILIEGSMFNDGVYKYTIPVEQEEETAEEAEEPSVETQEEITVESQFKDEEFDGVVSILAIPSSFLDLVDDIKAYCDKNTENGYISESFGGYSYTKSSKNGVVASWQDVFRSRLNTWRKL